MARQKKQTATTQTGFIPFNELVWVLNNLTADELHDLDERQITIDDVDSFLVRATEVGWAFSIGYDDKSECTKMSMRQQDRKHPNAGFAIGARSQSALDCLYILYYKFVIVSEGVLDGFSVEPGNVRG